MKPWIKYGLWGVGGLVAIWLLIRAFAMREPIEDDTTDVVPLLTPGTGPGQVAGVSEFPSAVTPQAGITALDLLKFEREDEIRRAADAKAAADARALRLRQARLDKIEDRKAAAQTTFLRKTWQQVNEDRIAAGKAPYAVCVRKNGAIGVGRQCVDAIRRFGG